MKRRIPPLSAIRAFEAAARHLSFRAAAEELCVTPSAISHQVRGLEDGLGAPLFARTPASLALTAAGEAYLADLTPLLDGLDIATRRVAGGAPAERLTIHCTPGFAARWLVPRLARCPHPGEVSVSVSQGAPCTDFARNGADIVVHWRDAPVPGVVVEPLMRSAQYPVASPALVAREGIETPADLLRLPLIRAEVDDAWDDWLARAGVGARPARWGPTLAHCELSLTAAEREQGATMAYDAMARGAIREGRLVRLFEAEVPAVTIYSVARPESRRRCPALRRMRDWMFAEVEAEGAAHRRAAPDRG
jgi:LysR family glycine cleavage system transcriptional activator